MLSSPASSALSPATTVMMSPSYGSPATNASLCDSGDGENMPALTELTDSIKGEGQLSAITSEDNNGKYFLKLFLQYFSMVRCGLAELLHDNNSV